MFKRSLLDRVRAALGSLSSALTFKRHARRLLAALSGISVAASIAIVSFGVSSPALTAHAAGIALVGTIGMPSTGASGANVSPSWGTNETRAVGDLLVAAAVGTGTSGAGYAYTISGTGWSLGDDNVSGAFVTFFYKVVTSTGSDATPTITGISGDVMTVQLSEWSGASTDGVNVMDQWCGNYGTTSPLGSPGPPECSASNDITSGDLVLSSSAIKYTQALVSTSSDVMNNGATATTTKNASTSTANHYDFAYGVTTSNSVPTTDTLSFSTTHISIVKTDRLTIHPFKTAPTVTGISPTSGPTAGGTSVVITGTGFSSPCCAENVYFGSTWAQITAWSGTTSITATAPARSAGTIDVTVHVYDGSGTTATSSSDQYTYNSPTAPNVTSVVPGYGLPAGGPTNGVVINGTGFTLATAVKFGANNATNYTVNSDTKITATAPAGSVGAVDVKVTTTNGTNATENTDVYVYKNPLKGLLNRGGSNFPSDPTGCGTNCFRKNMGGYVIAGGGSSGVNWNELVDNNDPLSSGAILHNQMTCPTDSQLGNVIDCAVREVRAFNLANSTKESLKLRVYGGAGSPTYAFVDSGGTATGYWAWDISSTGNSFNIPFFWTAKYKTDWQNFMKNLAAAYDTTPEIGTVTASMDATIYSEPMLRQINDKSTAWNTCDKVLGNPNTLGCTLQNLLCASSSTSTPAQFTYSADKTSITDDAAFLTGIWNHTLFSFDVNPYDQAGTNNTPTADCTAPSSPSTNPIGTGIANFTKIDETATETMMTTIRTANSTTALEDNHADDTEIAGGNSDKYHSLFAKMESLGGNLDFQTSSAGKILIPLDSTSLLYDVLAAASGNPEAKDGDETVQDVSIKSSEIELPTPYDHGNANCGGRGNANDNACITYMQAATLQALF